MYLFNVKTCLSLFLLLLASCSPAEQEKSTDITNDFLAYINDLKEHNASHNIITKGDEFRTMMYLSGTRSNRLVFVEGQTWNVHLIDKEGKSIAVTGGGGRGPGEFDLINHAYLSDDDIFHLLDLGLKRVTKYSFRSDEPELLSVTNLPSYEMKIEKIFPLSDGTYIGIFKENIARTAGSFDYILYKLNEHFVQTQEIARLFGGKNMLLNDFPEPDEFRANAAWYFEDDQLYYAQSDTFSIKRIYGEGEHNIIHSSSPLRSAPDYNNDAYIKHYISDQLEYAFSFYPEMKEKFYEVKKLKYFTKFYIKENFIYFNLFNVSDTPGFILRYDLETSKITTVRTPPVFMIHHVFGNEITGISYSGQAKEIMSIEF